VDYGNIDQVPLDCLCVMSAVDQREPPQAVQCCLAGVKPVLVGWSDKSSMRFAALVEDKHLVAHVCVSLSFVSFSFIYPVVPAAATNRTKTAR